MRTGTQWRRYGGSGQRAAGAAGPASPSCPGGARRDNGRGGPEPGGPARHRPGVGVPRRARPRAESRRPRRNRACAVRAARAGPDARHAPDHVSWSPPSSCRSSRHPVQTRSRYVSAPGTCNCSPRAASPATPAPGSRSSRSQRRRHLPPVARRRLRSLPRTSRGCASTS